MSKKYTHFIFCITENNSMYIFRAKRNEIKSQKDIDSIFEEVKRFTNSNLNLLIVEKIK